MNPSTTELTLNMQLPNIAAVSWAVQGDQLARRIQATLVDGSAPWTPEASYTALVRYHKPDGTSGVYDVDEDGNPAVTWSGNVATVTIAQQALTVPGTVLMQLEFYDGNASRITAFGWANNVQPAAVTDTEFLSTDYYNLLTLQIAGVLGASGHPPYINSETKNWMVWNENTAAYIDSGVSSVGETGPAPTVTNTAYQYANSSSGTVVPTSWSDTRPATSPGTWAWTKTVITYNTGDTTTLYSNAYQGQDGEGAPGSATPLPDDTNGTVGTATAYSREDHRHPLPIASDIVMQSGNSVEESVTALETLVASGFTAKTTVTLPRTFGKSGILVISINPTTSSSGAYVIVNDGTNCVFSVPSGGTSGTFCLPVIKDSTITEGQKSNCSVTYVFFSLA